VVVGDRFQGSGDSSDITVVLDVNSGAGVSQHQAFQAVNGRVVAGLVFCLEIFVRFGDVERGAAGTSASPIELQGDGVGADPDLDFLHAFLFGPFRRAGGDSLLDRAD